MDRRLYPAFLSLDGRPVVVIGGGPLAQRKVRELVAAAAAVTLISPTLTAELGELAAAGTIVWIKRQYQAGDLSGAWLAVCACGVRAVDQAVAAEAAATRTWCNVVDMPELCTFQVPAVMRRGTLQIAISTGGTSPALATQLRQELEEHYGPAWERYLAVLGELREWARQRWPDDDHRRAEVLKAFVAARPWRLLEAGDERGLADMVTKLKTDCDTDHEK